MCGGLGMIMGIFGAVGSIMQGQAEAEDAKIRAEVAEMNAGVAETAAETDVALAELPRLSAQLDESRLRDTGRAVLGTEVATYSTANLDPTYGAPLMAQGATAAQLVTDINLIRLQGMLGHAERMGEAASEYAGAASQRFEVVRAKNQADAAMMNAIFGAATSLLKGFSGGGGGGALGGLFSGGGGGGASETSGGYGSGTGGGSDAFTFQTTVPTPRPVTGGTSFTIPQRAGFPG